MSVNAADTAWLLVSSSLVLLMTPGLALFYAGMVRRKNAISTTMMSFVMLGVGSMLWLIYGYSLSFGQDIGGVVGGLDFALLNGVGQKASAIYATTVPHLAFFAFQGMFTILAANNLHPLVTMEPHTEEDLWQSLEYLDQTNLLDLI